MSIHEQQPFLESLAKGVSTLFGEKCEVTIHDLTKDYENTIVAIENGHVTGRHIGDGASEIVLKALRDKEPSPEDNYAYFTRTKEGRVIKSMSIYLRDKDGHPVGLFGINYDLTEMIMAQHALETIVAAPKSSEQGEGSIATITTTVNELLDKLIEEADKYIGKPVALMTKEDKIGAIQYLNEKGAFLIKKSGDKISRHYDISKYTLYNYLDLGSMDLGT